MKKIISILLAVMLVVSVATVSVNAAKAATAIIPSSMTVLRITQRFLHCTDDTPLPAKKRSRLVTAAF